MTVKANLDSVLSFLNNMDGEVKNELIGEFCFDEKDIEELEKDLDIIESGIYPVGETIGGFMEKFVKKLCVYKGIFVVESNVHTSTNEIDLLIKWSAKGEVLRTYYFNELPETAFLIECKNYKKKIDVTWVGKFYSLMRSTNANVGILFSRKGFTARGPWKDAKGLSKKMALKDSSYVLDVSVKDFELLRSITLADLLVMKKKEIEMDININSCITPHPGEK